MLSEVGGRQGGWVDALRKLVVPTVASDRGWWFQYLANVHLIGEGLRLRDTRLSAGMATQECTVLIPKRLRGQMGLKLLLRHRITGRTELQKAPLLVTASPFIMTQSFSMRAGHT